MTRVRDGAVYSQEIGVAGSGSTEDGCAAEAFRRGIALVRQRSRHSDPAGETCLALAEAALAAATLTGPHAGCGCRPPERCPACHLREVFDGARAAVSNARFAVVAAADRQRLASGVACVCPDADR
ncbi:hypothetical protein ACN27G_06780 [Plantactinospora sp. WMMB334]|uniref:hypothetical protein n=1 Tax=Plantactinospora sp. WMMB334 TaxID=3404119 RepID=UPI003B963F05